MAAGGHQSIAEKQVQLDPASPSSVSTTPLTKPAHFDCEAAGGNVPSRACYGPWLASSGSRMESGIYKWLGRWRRRLGLTGLTRLKCNPDAQDTHTRSLEDCQNGYPRLAAFLSSEHSFSIYRGFGYLHARVLLNLQDQIVALERELDGKDAMDQANDQSLRLQSRGRDERESRQDGDTRPREQILEDIRTKLVQYGLSPYLVETYPPSPLLKWFLGVPADEMLIKARDLNAFQKPAERDYRSVRNWISNLKPVVEKEQEFIKCKEDVLTLHSGREWCGFDGFVETVLLKLDCKLIRYIFLTPELRVKTVDQNIHYYKRSRVDIFISLIITTVIFVLLVVPVVAMYKLTTVGARPNSTFNAIGILAVFTLLFSATMSLLTKARRHELFAASAAYCAILVVFISNVSTID